VETLVHLLGSVLKLDTLASLREESLWISPLDLFFAVLVHTSSFHQHLVEFSEEGDQVF
jgi:hypothetical protein